MKRVELLYILEKVKPGIASKDAIESMTYFFFSGTDVITYNDHISIQHPLKTDFSLFVKAKDLHKVMSRLTADTIKLSEVKGKLNVRSKTMNANLATILDDEVSVRIDAVTDSLKKAEWKALPDNFTSCLRLCSYTASKQESDQTLTCVYVNDTDCISSDKDRISHAKLDGPVDELFIKASEIGNLVNVVPTHYAVTRAWLHFRNSDNCIFSIRRVDGSFPEFLQFLDFEGKKVELPSELIEGMDITAVFADTIDPTITVKISKGYCLLSVKSDTGTAQYRAKIDYKGSELEFNVNPGFLRQMMEHSSSIVIGKDKIRLQTDDNGFSLVTALIE